MSSTKDAGPVAIVTGAGRGIGLACAKALAEASFNVALMSPSASSLALAKELGGIGMQGSVLDAADIRRFVQAALERYGRIDAVVNNMGHVGTLPRSSGRIGFHPGDEFDLMSIDDDTWVQGFEMYVLGVMRMARAVTPAMIEQGGGAIVNISSRNALEPSFASPVGVVRGTLHGYCKLYADRFASENVRMNNLLPGICEHSAISDDVRVRIPMGRPALLSEVGRCCAFLASPASSYMTGQNILLDGGLNRAIR